MVHSKLILEDPVREGVKIWLCMFKDIVPFGVNGCDNNVICPLNNVKLWRWTYGISFMLRLQSVEDMTESCKFFQYITCE